MGSTSRNDPHSSVLLLNAQSLNPCASSSARWKIDELRSLVIKELSNNHLLPFIALTETWLKSYVSDAQVNIPGYVVSRCDRDVRVGGGAMLYSHVNVPLSSCEKFDDSMCQAIFCCFDSTKHAVAVVYRPPSAPSSSFLNMMSFMESCLNQIGDDYQVSILGDFNFPFIDWSNGRLSGTTAEATSSARKLISLAEDRLLNQHVHCSTRGTNILDLYFTNNDRYVVNVSATETELSDHKLIDIMIADNPSLADKSDTRPLFDGSDFRSLDFRQADFEKLNKHLSEVNWPELRNSCADFEDYPALFTSTVLSICKDSVPLKKPGTGRPQQANALRRQKKRVKARLAALQERGAPANQIRAVKEKLNLISYDIKHSICKAQDDRELRAIKRVKSNPKYFYSYAKSKARTKSSITMLLDKEDNVTTDPGSIANLLQDQFKSVFSDPNAPGLKDPTFPTPNVTEPLEDDDFVLTNADVIGVIKDIPNDSASGPDGIPVVLLKNCAESLCEPIRILWEESFSRNVVPAFYKRANISPLFKKGDRSRAKNYRPVALTSHIIKICERIWRIKMVQFIEKNNILCNHQHGFRKGRSCLTQLLHHFDDVLTGLTKGVDTDAIYLDFAKAFDKVDHRLLIEKLKRYGFHPKLISWIESFLRDREQHVVVDGVSSIVAIILSGVPQGSVLGPLLFILYIDDMQHCVKFSIIRFFADDTRIMKRIMSEMNVEELQEDLNAVSNWAAQNNMVLHEDKFELIVHRHSTRLDIYELPFTFESMIYQTSNGDPLYPVGQLRDLGITVSEDLSWSSHIYTIACRARGVASWALGAFRSRDRTTMMTLYKSLVRSHLEYCCPLWNPQNRMDIQQLESVQRSFTSRISGVQHLDYWNRLRALNLMSLQRRRERYIILHVWKILRGITPNDLDFQFSNTSRQGIKAIVPALLKTSSARNQTLYDASFRVMGARLWNIIPVSLHNIMDPLQFKVKLTAFLKSFPDKPPTAGYACTNSNAILDWNNVADINLSGRSGHPMTQ